MVGMRGWLWVVLLLVASRADAQPVAAGVRVSIDWQGVRDRDIERCGLSRLRAGVIERLLADGYALVESVDESGVRVAIASSGEGIAIHVSARGAAREAELRAGEPCDATFALDVIARVAELVDELAGEAAATTTQPATVATTPDVPPQHEHERDDASRFHAAIDATLRVNQALSWLAGGGLSARVQRPSGLSLGGRAELVAAAHLDVTVVEVMGAFVAAYHPGDALFGPCFELGPVVHLVSSGARSVTALDATLGAGVQLSAGHFVGQLLFYGRLRSFEHRVAGEIAHDSGRAGLALRLGAQL
jgi:hypothetical protein